MTPNEEHLSIAELFLLFYYKDGKLYNRITRNSRAVIDTEAGAFLNNFGYRVVTINKRKYRVHRIIWAMHNGRWPEGKLEIDHEDINPRNNCSENLREVSRSENCFNKKNIKGYYKTNDKWRAHIEVNGKKYASKRRDTEEEAIQDRKELEDKYRSVVQR